MGGKLRHENTLAAASPARAGGPAAWHLPNDRRSSADERSASREHAHSPGAGRAGRRRAQPTAMIRVEATMAQAAGTAGLLW